MSFERIVRLPSLHDHHSHVSLYASFEGLPDLAGLDSAEASRLLDGLPRDRLNLVKGWRTDRLPREALGASDLAGFPPFLLVNSSLHGYALSPGARPLLAGLWPEFAEHASDPAWGERNLPRLFVFYGQLAGLDSGKLASFMGKMEALGLGSIEDMTVAGEEALALVSGSAYSERILSWATPEIYRRLSPSSRALCAGVKIFLDGSLGAKSAALDAPFLDGSEGALLYSDEELSMLLAELASYRACLSAHALGHSAVAQALRCLEALGREAARFPSVRLEHVQFISASQARRCKESGIRLSMQPNFNSDSSDYADRLIPRHRAENDPFRMLIDEAGFVPGEDLLFGSDGMPHGPEYALRWSLFPDFEAQALSVEEFEAGYGIARGVPGQGSAFVIETETRTIRTIPD
jgi:predicted amidohydrolase YtcJ